MKNLKRVTLTLAIFGLLAGLLVVTPTAEAVDIYQACGSNRDSQVCGSTNDSASVFIKRIVNVLFFILGAVAVVMIIISGIRFVTSAGNATQVTAAKNTLLYSVIGLAVAVFAYAIVTFVVDAL